MAAIVAKGKTLMFTQPTTERLFHVMCTQWCIHHFGWRSSLTSVTVQWNTSSCTGQVLLL